MNWNNLEQMIKDLDLKSNPEDIKQLKKELKTRIKELHPDTSRRKFLSEEESKKLYLLYDALDYCDEEKDALIPLDYSTEIIKKLSDELTHINKESIDVRINRTSLDHQAYIGQKFQWPKISLGAISAIFTYIFLSPDQLINHPIIGNFFKQNFTWFHWLIAVEILAVIWFITWKSETYTKAIASELFSLDYHRGILNKLKHSNSKFSRTQLKDNFSSIGERRLLSRIFHLSLDSTTIDDATNLAIERYLERKWIRCISGKNINEDIDDWYEIII